MSQPVGPYALPPLKHGYKDFAPVIDAETMRLHHSKHHQSYVDSVNAVLSKHPDWLGLTIEEVLRRLREVPVDVRQAVRDQGGGHANHQFFWKILVPGGAPEGPRNGLLSSLQRDFGSVEEFKRQFQAAGTAHFGSGWAFLVCRPKQNFKLEIMTLSNQDSVLSQPEPAPGLLCCDLWEHAYYLTYRNRRADWLKAWWALVNWPYVAERLQGVREGRQQL
jgi:superoxide dismutase, Fe-Mn family